MTNSPAAGFAMSQFNSRFYSLALGTILGILSLQPAQAQTFTVLHHFTGGADGGNPWAGLTMDRAGNLYGTASSGGTHLSGTVFKLTRSRTGWTFNPLYSFAGGSNDGSSPIARILFAPSGSPYGTTAGGGPIGFGTVYNLRPPARTCGRVLCPWNESVVHGFAPADGFYPTGDLLFDQSGNIFGTAMDGPNGGECGGNGCGVVFKLAQSQGNWIYNIVYQFRPAPDANVPQGGLLSDSSGNFYGTTCDGGTQNRGTVFRMTPSGSEQILYNFQAQSDGYCPATGLIFDSAGNLYGTASNGGAHDGGTAFELMPSNGGWNFVLLYSFGFHALASALTMDAPGNLYGTTFGAGAFGNGAVFKLTPSQGGWVYTSLHDFTNGDDGGFPISTVVFDANGHLYGTAAQGADQECFFGCGVVWEITL